MQIRLIKNDRDYHEALAQVEMLALQDPEMGSAEADRLGVLAVLVEDYERNTYVFDAPDPVSAIEFRMAEQGLRQRDLIPMLGSRSRVSEVLSRKRSLTLPMIRALSEGLGIPTDVLVKPSEERSNDEETDFDWSKFPFKEMQKRGWIPADSGAKRIDAITLVKQFLSTAGEVEVAPLYRKTIKGLGIDGLNESSTYATLAWIARVLQRAKSMPISAEFKISDISSEFLQEISRLSRREDGPLQAANMLAEVGIKLIIEPRLPSTLVDGAAMLDYESRPVIGLTLRFDRIDYFWFTLMHELAHVWKHLNSVGEAFVDRIDSGDGVERIEKEANKIARDALIPRDLWDRSVARVRPSLESIEELARQAQVHRAIVAGRVRFESGDFTKFSKLLGQGSVRKNFPECKF